MLKKMWRIVGKTSCVLGLVTAGIGIGFAISSKLVTVWGV